MTNNSQIIIYQNENGEVKLDIRFACDQNNINCFDYFSDVLTRLPSALNKDLSSYLITGKNTGRKILCPFTICFTMDPPDGYIKFNSIFKSRIHPC